MQFFLAILMTVFSWSGLVILNDAKDAPDANRGETLLAFAFCLLVAIVILGFR